VLFLVLYLLIERTEFGLALQATSEDRDAARLVGIRPQRMFSVAWGLGAALVAIAGAILVNFFSVYPQVGLQFTVLAYAIVALGGFGSILGTLLAALLVGVIQSVTVVYLPPAFKDAFVFGSYLLIGLLRPQGLFGRF
jgi:branched-chain amino acid transport system permease protein